MWRGVFVLSIPVVRGEREFPMIFFGQWVLKRWM